MRNDISYIHVSLLTSRYRNINFSLRKKCMNIKREKHLFLDLEDTCITPIVQGWNQFDLINLQKIKRVIEEFNPDFLHIFSFAIWNKADLNGFDLNVRPLLEKSLGKTIGIVPTVDDDILPACCKERVLRKSTVSFQDMNNFWGKHEAFRLFIRQLFQDHGGLITKIEVMLLDDCVINETFAWPDLSISGKIVNIDTLKNCELPL